MSKNAKNARKLAAAKQISKQRVGGGKGPARTECKNAKPKAWFRLKDKNGRLLVLTNKGKPGKKAHDAED